MTREQLDKLIEGGELAKRMCKSLNVYPSESNVGSATIFLKSLPLDTPALLCSEIKKLREANEVMREALRRVHMIERPKTARMCDSPEWWITAEQMNSFAVEALAKVQEIMGGDDDR